FLSPNGRILSRAYNNPLILWFLRTIGRRKAPSMRMTRRRCRPSLSNTTPALFRTWEFLGSAYPPRRPSSFGKRMHAFLTQYPERRLRSLTWLGVAEALTILAA